MSKYVVEANVVLLPGQYPQDIPKEQLECAQKCNTFIHEFMNGSQTNLVLDSEWRILKEYGKIYTYRSEPSITSEFLKWLYPALSQGKIDTVALNEIRKDEFASYPSSERLKLFDPPDRKYIAVSYNHPEKPYIVEGSDSKWWGIKEELKDVGIGVQFVDEDYIKRVYEKKFGAGIEGE